MWTSVLGSLNKGWPRRISDFLCCHWCHDWEDGFSHTVWTVTSHTTRLPVTVVVMQVIRSKFRRICQWSIIEHITAPQIPRQQVKWGIFIPFPQNNAWLNDSKSVGFGEWWQTSANAVIPWRYVIVGLQPIVTTVSFIGRRGQGWCLASVRSWISLLDCCQTALFGVSVECLQSHFRACRVSWRLAFRLVASCRLCLMKVVFNTISNMSSL